MKFNGDPYYSRSSRRVYFSVKVEWYGWKYEIPFYLETVFSDGKIARRRMEAVNPVDNYSIDPRPYYVNPDPNEPSEGAIPVKVRLRREDMRVTDEKYVTLR